LLHKLKYAFKNRTTGSAAKALSENIKNICKGNFSDIYGFIFYLMGGTVASAYKNRSLLNRLRSQYFDIEKNCYNFNGVRLPAVLSEDIFARSSFLDEMEDIIFSSVGIPIQSFNEGPYEYGQVKIPTQGYIFDIGANLGTFSAVASARITTGKGKIFAFEPIPKVFKYLQSTANLHDNIVPVQKAVSNCSGNFDMYYNGNSNSSIMFDKGGKKLTVATVTLDEFIEKNNLKSVDFIKADIEGAERNMLKGAKWTLKDFAPMLAICTYHLPDDKEVLEALIKESNPNYVIEHRWKKLYAYIPK
jgi:FkbM family methyltransferase